MKTIELTRHNVTPAEFLAYCRYMTKKNGIGAMDFNLDYWKNGNDLNFDYIHHDDIHEGLRERSVSKPYEYQTYMNWPDGTTFNEICEFDFWDEKKGTGYYYFIDTGA